MMTSEYTLRDGVEYPYAGMYFSTEINRNFTDLSGYDYLNLQIAVSVRGCKIIKGCSFPESFTLLYMLSGSVCILSTVVILLIFFRFSRKKRYNGGFSSLEYNPVKLSSYSEDDTEKLTEFIMNNYTDPDLSVERLYTESGTAGVSQNNE